MLYKLEILTPVVVVIYLDFSRTFDVNHSVLIGKLNCLGFNSQILEWVERFFMLA